MFDRRSKIRTTSVKAVRVDTELLKRFILELSKREPGMTYPKFVKRAIREYLGVKDDDK